MKIYMSDSFIEALRTLTSLNERRLIYCFHHDLLRTEVINYDQIKLVLSPGGAYVVDEKTKGLEVAILNVLYCSTDINYKWFDRFKFIDVSLDETLKSLEDKGYIERDTKYFNITRAGVYYLKNQS